MDTCLFCKNDKDLSSALGPIFYEDDVVYALHYCRDDGPSYLGHLVLATKRHVPGLAELTEAEAQAVGLSVARLSRALKVCTDAEKVYLEAYYEVNPHLHLHLIARYPETPQEYWRWKVGDWPEAPRGEPEAIIALCERLRAHLAQKLPGNGEQGHPSTSSTPMKRSILALLHFARQQELKLIDQLSDAERNASGTPDSWEAKDFLANIMRWKELQTHKLAAAQHGEIPPAWKDMEAVHQINSQTFTDYQTHTFQEIEENSEHGFHALTAQVERMSDEELNDPDHYAWQEGERLRGELLKHGLWYPCDQLTTLSLQHGKRQFAFDLQEALLEAVRRSELPSEGIAVAIYNLACFYVRNSEPEKAIQLLPEALQLRPSLIEWCRHDSDMDPLRANTAFQAIFADPQLLALAPASELMSAQDLYASICGEVASFVIDVRGSAEYAAGHVPGAVHIPLGQLESRLKQIPLDRPVVAYCNMHHRGESRGERAAVQLRALGYHARALDGGYPGWKEHGFPAEEPSSRGSGSI
jgi:rhodanese-related sulfurtransferase/diadenosine tetraphosphate (Ap4A) HIT family hydrolase